MRTLTAGLAWLALGAPAAAQPEPPQGSYAARCEGAEMRGSTLRAMCRNISGQLRESSIDVLACRGEDIRVAEDGALACPGNGKPGLVLYTGTVWRGEWRAVRGDVDDLARIGLNDRVRSIELAADAGRWEVCSTIRFGGRCQVLTTSVPDTGALGMANEISSVRRLP